MTDPFTALGLPPDPRLTDDQVRAAWRAIATQTHPDRPDGGNPAAYAAASAAYAQLRTGWGRREAYADLTETREPGTSPLPAIPPEEQVQPPGTRAFRVARAALLLPGRVIHGHPLRLLLRALIAAAVSLAVLALIPGRAAAPADITGITLWFVLTGRCDLAPLPDEGS